MPSCCARRSRSAGELHICCKYSRQVLSAASIMPVWLQCSKRLMLFVLSLFYAIMTEALLNDTRKWRLTSIKYADLLKCISCATHFYIISCMTERRFDKTLMCRVGCGACCIAPSISSPIPGMPSGKPAGVRCVQLTPDNRCRLFGRPERPAVCRLLQPSSEMCGSSRQEALRYLTWLERATAPEK